MHRKLIDANADLPAGVSEDEEKRRQDIYRYHVKFRAILSDKALTRSAGI